MCKITVTLTDMLSDIIRLKEVKRAGWVAKLHIADGESVADHSYSTAMIGMILSDMLELDSEKVIRMALLHDLAESEIGDIMPGRMPRAQKSKLEDVAFERIMSKLPSDSPRSAYTDIWREYCQNDTPESRLVHQVDSLDMALQAAAYERTKRTGHDVGEFISSADVVITDATIRDILEEIMQNRG